MLTHIFGMLMPWQLWPTVLVATLAALAAYLLGWRRCHLAGEAVAPWRPALFLTGVALFYVCLQTRVDYLAQHMFWVHRVQHLVLHHLAPFLIAVSAPHHILECGTPDWVKGRILRPLWRCPFVQGLYRTLQQPFIASLLFVGLIYFWLTPSVHFDAMLSLPLYRIMNGSMVVDGLLFWWLMVGPEDAQRLVRPGYGTRIAVLLGITLPQTAIGAYITFHHSVIYDAYSVCGRAWPIPPLLDQQLGGLNTWIPAGMMSAAGVAVVAARWLRAQPHAPHANPALNAGRADLSYRESTSPLAQADTAVNADGARAVGCPR